jgi:hypothetical protein
LGRLEEREVSIYKHLAVKQQHTTVTVETKVTGGTTLVVVTVTGGNVLVVVTVTGG